MKQLRWVALAAALIIALAFGNLYAGAVPFLGDNLETNLVAYWKLEEASGTRVDELSGCGGSGCDLTDNNTVTQNTGIIGNAGQFTVANNEYLTASDAVDLSTGNIDYTVAAWAYLDSLATSRGFVAKGGASNSTEYWLYYSQPANRMRFVITSDGTTAGAVQWSSAPITSTWYYVVAWHDSTNDLIAIQVNNGTPITATWSAGGFDSSGPFYVGRITSGGSMDGRIDEVGFWKRVLYSDERTLLYNSGAGCTYPFDACQGTRTPTPTNTSTPTDTPTVTLTPTPTNTSTSTNTPTDTPTPTNTSTSTNTPTDTPTPTLTSTNTPTDTPTPTPTDTPTITPTPTNTLTPTAGPTSDVFDWIVAGPTGYSYRILRQWTVGEMFVMFAIILLIVIIVGVKIYDEVRRTRQ